MGYSSEHVGDRVVIDIETCASPSAAHLLDPVRAPKTYKDPAKIDAYCKEEFEKRVANAALEADLCEVVAVGWQHPNEESATVYTRGEDGCEEVALLYALWDEVDNRAVVGFNSLGFDLPVLIRRSQILGAKYPRLNLDRYRTPHVDLLETLTFNGKLTYRSLKFYARLFGLPCEDQHKGADIAALVAAGEWGAVASHCRADVETTTALARRLGYLSAPVAEAVGF